MSLLLGKMKGNIFEVDFERFSISWTKKLEFEKKKCWKLKQFGKEQIYAQNLQKNVHKIIE